MRFLFHFVLLLITSLVYTDLAGQSFDAGITLGLTATQVDGDSHGGYNKAGPLAGIWVERKLTGFWYGRLELRYAQKGSYKKSSTEAATFYRIRLHYFEMPVLFGYKFSSGFQVNGGLSIGYLSKAEEMNELGSFPEDDLNAFKKYEFAGLLGLDYIYNERWSLGAYFSYSILPIRPHKGNITYRLSKGQYNRVLELVVRYRIQ